VTGHCLSGSGAGLVLNRSTRSTDAIDFIALDLARLVAIVDPYPIGGIPPGPEAEQIGWTGGMLEAFSAAATLNFRAARWTAASVVLNGLAAVLGTLPDLSWGYLHSLCSC
jgi:hypothetical protein